MEPALPALRLRTRVPGDAERLQAAARELDQVLLQRRDAERVVDRVVGELAVGTVGADEELAVAPGKDRRGPRVRELCVIEIAQHRSSRSATCIARSWCDPRHAPVLLGVALRADAAPDVLRDLGRGRKRRRPQAHGEHGRCDVRSSARYYLHAGCRRSSTVRQFRTSSLWPRVHLYSAKHHFRSHAQCGDRAGPHRPCAARVPATVAAL